MDTNETVLVTGGAGFIGSHLCNLLIAENFRVRVIDDLSSGDVSRLPKNIEFIEGSVENSKLVESATRGVKYVFHLAAMSRSGPSVQEFDRCLVSNIIGTRNVLEASKIHSVEKLVYSASSTCYGNTIGLQSVDSPIDLLNPYGWSKHAGENLCLMYSNLYKLPIVSLRYFNVYGQHQPRDGAYALVLGIFLERFSINKPLEIHGGGKQRRDFVHVSDVARCNLLAAQSSIQSGIYNVGSGKNISIRDLANLISNDQIDAPARIGDALETLADIRATTLDLDWSPKIHINEGVQLMLKEIS